MYQTSVFYIHTAMTLKLINFLRDFSTFPSSLRNTTRALLHRSHLFLTYKSIWDGIYLIGRLMMARRGCRQLWVCRLQ